MAAPRLPAVLRRDLLDLHAYAVQPSAGLVKLDTMENPYRLPDALQSALGERLGAVALNRYPAERGDDLKAALAAHARMPAGCALTLGNGSDELISMLTMAVATPGAVVLSPQPSFVMYAMSAQLLGLRHVGVALTEDFELDAGAMLDAIAAHRPALVWIAQPNNPTANLWDEAAIERIAHAVAAVDGLLVIDEAYQPFASRDAMGMLARHPHVLVMRTMSKFGLAGVRIGYLIGRAALVAEVDKLRPPFNVSVLNAEAALFALEHVAEFERQAAAIRAERARVVAALAQRPGVTVWPSEANMVLARVPQAQAVHAAMKARGVLIKFVGALHPRLADCLRFTVGTPDENTVMLAAFDAARADAAATAAAAPF